MQRLWVSVYKETSSVDVGLLASTNAYLPILKMLRYSMKHAPIQRSPKKKNGYNTNLQFDKTCSCTDKNNEKNKTRKRKFTWFNPPFNINVATNVTKTFLTLLDKHFPKNKRLSKIFNRNTTKVSYSWGLYTQQKGRCA